MTKKTEYRSEIAAAVHEGMRGMHRLGLVDDKTMQEFDLRCMRTSTTRYASVDNDLQVQNALDMWNQTLRATPGAQTAWRTIGFQGGNARREVIWLPQHHIWAYVGDWNDRPWTAYGHVGNQLPENLDITLEINPRVSHFKKSWGRILVRDDQPNRMYLAHIGGKGGKRRIKKQVFFERIKDIERDSDRWFVLGDVTEQSTVENVVNYSTSESFGARTAWIAEWQFT